MKEHEKARRIIFYRLLISVSIPEKLAFKVSENLSKNAKRKLSILCPLNKNSDVTSRTWIYSIINLIVNSGENGSGALRRA